MESDFLIVGGGIAGVSAAARLAELGTVTLLEAEPHLAHHASGRSAALFEPHYGLAPVVALSLASDDHHRNANGGVLSPRGMMILGGADDAEAFAHDRAALRLDEVTVAEAREMVPIVNPETVVMAAHATHAWDIDTDLLTQNFAREARAGGGSFVTGARVDSLSRADGAWYAGTPKGTFVGRILVNAAGAWVDDVARMAGIAPLGFRPLRRSVARIPAPGGNEVATWPLIMGAGETWYAKPDAGALIVSPAEEDPTHPHDAWADDMVLAEGIARYEAMVTEPVTRLTASWAGLRTFSPDRVPVIGRAPEEPSFFWLAGQGGYGFQTAPAASRLVADLIAARSPEIDAATVAALSPARFA